jgi:CHAT domain-containing protein
VSSRDLFITAKTHFCQANPEHLPRIWWCATGSLAFLPIHAAGIYGTEGGEKLSDYVVSCYTPTLAAILEQSPPLARDNFQMLTVAQSSTSYATPIPGTENEIKRVRNLAGGLNVVSLENKDATVERVLEEMKNANWIHLACHGQQCTGNPMKSGLLLHDRILELSEIVKSTLPKADFAFLSACQTAMGDERIAEESVHLAAGMFMAGYRSVIATMWSIRDRDAPQIAEDVYRRMLQDGRPNGKEAAHALHDAVKRLRESGAGFISWVPFIHIGR